MKSTLPVAAAPLVLVSAAWALSAAAASQSDDAGAGAGIVLLLVVLAIYFLPWIIANHRRHHNQVALFWLNLLLGWTLIGWVAALVWAFAKPPTVIIANSPASPPEERYPCPFCAEAIIPAARGCRFCGRELPADWRQVQRGPGHGTRRDLFPIRLSGRR